MHHTHTTLATSYMPKNDSKAQFTVVQLLNSAERTKWAYIFRP